MTPINRQSTDLPLTSVFADYSQMRRELKNKHRISVKAIAYKSKQMVVYINSNSVCRTLFSSVYFFIFIQGSYVTAVHFNSVKNQATVENSNVFSSFAARSKETDITNHITPHSNLIAEVYIFLMCLLGSTGLTFRLDFSSNWIEM